MSKYVVTNNKLMKYNFGGVRCQRFAIESMTNEWLIAGNDG